MVKCGWGLVEHPNIVLSAYEKLVAPPQFVYQSFSSAPINGLQMIKSQGKTNFLGELEHAIVFGQNKPENALKAFLSADVDKQLQKASSEPVC
jgi:hypothetical protein